MHISCLLFFRKTKVTIIGIGCRLNLKLYTESLCLIENSTLLDLTVAVILSLTPWLMLLLVPGKNQVNQISRLNKIM